MIYLLHNRIRRCMWMLRDVSVFNISVAGAPRMMRSPFPWLRAVIQSHTYAVTEISANRNV